MSLDLMPPELIRKILHQVDLRDAYSREGLRHLSRSSGRYHLLVQPFLYSILIQSRTHAVPLFLRSILANPSLANYTRELKSSAFTAPFAYNVSSVLSHSQRIRLEGSIYSACDNDEIFANGWIEAIFNNTNNYDAVTAITLCLVPNLESLQIDSYGLPGGNLYLEHVFNRAAMLQERTASVLPYRMENLSRVSLSYHDDQEPELDAFKNFYFIRPPSVKSFFCKGLASDNGPSMYFKSGVPEITFDSFAVLDFTVIHILHHFVALRTFRFTRYRPFYLNAFTHGLRSSRETLEKLVIRDDGLHMNSNFLSRFDRTDWREFGKLVHLDISWYALTEPLHMTHEDNTDNDENELQYQEITKKFLQRLPLSLKFLRMSSCDRTRISPFVKALVIGKEVYTPSLKEVVLELGWVADGELDEHKGQKARQQKLVDFCMTFEVRLKIILDS